MLSLPTIIVVLATTLTFASPIPASGSELLVQGAERIEEVTCAGKNDMKTLSRGNVRAAFDELHLRMNGPKVMDKKGNPFPGVFNVSETTDTSLSRALRLSAWAGCEPGQADTAYLQFPISVQSGRFPKYEGGSPGRDRVLALVRGKDSGDYKNPLYCGAITLRGSDKKGDGFDPCSQKSSPQNTTPQQSPQTGQQISPGMVPQQMPPTGQQYSPGMTPQQMPPTGQQVSPGMMRQGA